MTAPLSRRRFLQSGSMAASTLVLPGARMLSASLTEVDAHIEISPTEPIGTIAPEIYSHFIEQLGGVIYDGVWVGEKSKIPNEHGVRKAFLDGMREIKAPVLRWPGGCFADSYDWRDGIGPKRPQRTAFWTQEDSNQFGTHEFMFTCKAIGCEPYLAGNLRSLPARDYYQWMEYCNAPAGIGNELAEQRARNGSREPFHVKYWGVGNESWGCGGSMTPEEYAHMYRQYTVWLPKYKDQPIHLVGVGPNGYDLEWTRRLFEALHGQLPWGLSTHYYVSGDPKKFASGDALQFSNDEYYDVLARATSMERIIRDHWLEMQNRDKEHNVKFVIDEWGAWYGDGSKIGPQYNLSQVPTMRDALLTGLTFDIFQRHADKVAMACVAQTINCIHSLMLAKEDQFITTPVFNVFKMYMPHMGAQAVRAEFASVNIANPIAQRTPVGGESAAGAIPPEKYLAGLSGSASMRERQITLSVVNSNLTQPLTTEILIRGASVASATGSMVNEKDVHAHNSFESPHSVMTKQVTVDVTKRNGNSFVHTFPPASVSVLTLNLA